MNVLISFFRKIRHSPRLISISLIFMIAAVYGVFRLSAVGRVLGVIDGVPVMSNGSDFTVSYGKSFDTTNTVYFGQKWQCVEFVKRYLFLVRGFTMIDGLGHAREFFDITTQHGGINRRRGMLQFKNGDTEPPLKGDIIVWNRSKYGHVAVVSEVGKDYVTVAQQNKKPTFNRLTLITVQDSSQTLFWIEKGDPGLVGWLRVPPK